MQLEKNATYSRVLPGAAAFLPEKNIKDVLERLGFTKVSITGNVFSGKTVAATWAKDTQELNLPQEYAAYASFISDIKKV